MRYFLSFFATFVFLLIASLFLVSLKTPSHTATEDHSNPPKTMKKNIDVILYTRPNCPFCQKVLSVLDHLGIDVTIIDVSKDPKALADLISVGGKSQVPCIIINGEAMYESQSIIEWFKQQK